MPLSPRTGAKVIALGRVAFGVSMLARPTLMEGWIGPAAQDAGAQVALRAVGIRDVILGAMTLHTVGHPEVAPRWATTCAVADAADMCATLAAKGRLPDRKVAISAAFAGASAAAGFAIAQGLKAER